MPAASRRATAKWLEPDEQDSWRSFVHAVTELLAGLEHDLAPHGLTNGDYSVLVLLSEAPDQQMRMCDLAAELQLSPSGLTRRLDGLVRQGWVERTSCTSDRRVTFARLTPKGRRKIESAAPDHVDGVRRRLLDPLGPRGVEQLGVLMRRVRAEQLAERRDPQ